MTYRWILLLALFAVPANALPEVYIVLFPEAPLAEQWAALRASSGDAATRVDRRLDPHSTFSRGRLAALDRQQADHQRHLESLVGRPLEPLFRYRAAGNGLALRLSPEEARKIAGSPRIRRIARDVEHTAATDRTPAFLGAPAVWDGTAVTTGTGFRGEGVVVGVLDSGINFDHPSFTAVAEDGYVHSNPLGSGTFLGFCDPGHPRFDPAFACNAKLIGAWDFEDPISGGDGPEDDAGHGSHVAGTAVGNQLGNGKTAGIAPRANLVVYDVCRPAGPSLSCPTSATFAAIDQAILDGIVDVLNFSVTGGTSPWGIDADRFFLNAVAAGMVVVAAGGNTGTPGTVQHLGPWMTTVASTTHDRVAVENRLEGFLGGLSPPDEPITGASRTAGYGPAPMVRAADSSNGEPQPRFCEAPFPAATWSGEIVLCERGQVDRTLACAHALAGGAGACVFGNSGFTDARPVPEAHVLPATHVIWADRNTLNTWLIGGMGHRATLTAAAPRLDGAAADRMASSSSAGPNPAFDGLKPDLAAPGVEIFAPRHTTSPLTAPEFGTMSGTSMASPHVAGAAALLRGLHPTWTPDEIRSALMTTANPSLADGPGDADAHDAGAGRLDLSRAALAGLVLDETAAKYLAANPDQGGDPRSLNLPSLENSDCDGRCSWQRSVRSTRSAAVTWIATGTAIGASSAALRIEVSPPSFEMDDPTDLQALTVTTQVLPGAPVDFRWIFGEILLTPNDATIPTARLPVAIFPTGVDRTIFTDGFESGNVSRWSQAVP
ncbi:MAG: S8 family serine peptidase [Acidobacteriota bacterium]